jgi:hypothetical protein
MISCTMSAAWSRPVLSLYCTKHGMSRDAIISGHITIVAMSRSGQVGRCCTVGAYCSGLGQLSISLFMWSTACRGPWNTW